MAPTNRGQASGSVGPARAHVKIVAAAERLLAQGERFTEVPVARLLVESGVSRSTFYAHFPNKAAVLAAVAELRLAEIVVSSDNWPEINPDGLYAMTEVVVGLVELYRAHGSLLRNIVEVGGYDPTIRDLWRRRRETVADRVAAGIWRAQARGSVGPAVDVALTASYMTLVFDRAVLEHVVHGSPESDRDLAVALARTSWLAYFGDVPGDPSLDIA